MQSSNWGEVWNKVVTFIKIFPTVCGTPLTRKEIAVILDFYWSGVKLTIWLPTFFWAITCVLSTQMGYASPFLKSMFQELFNDIKNLSIQWVLTPTIALWKFGSSLGLQLPKWEFTWECGVHSFTLSCTPGSMKCDSRAHFRPAPLQALALVVSPRLGLQHIHICASIFWFINKNVKNAKMGFYGQSNMRLLQMELEILT